MQDSAFSTLLQDTAGHPASPCARITQRRWCPFYRMGKLRHREDTALSSSSCKEPHFQALLQAVSNLWDFQAESPPAPAEQPVACQ